MSTLLFDFIGSLFLIITAILTLLSMRKLMQTYKINKEKSVLYFIWAFIFALIGSITLTFFSIMAAYNFYINPSYSPSSAEEMIGLLGLIIGITLSTIGLIFINIFSFENTYPDKKKPLIVLVVISGALFVFTLIFALVNSINGGNLAIIEGYYLFYDPLIVILGFLSILPSTISTPTVFIYFSRKMHAKSKGKANRSLLFGIGFLFTNIGFVIGTLSFGNADIYLIISMISRTVVFLSAIIIYLCIILPDWFKKKIGLVETE